MFQLRTKKCKSIENRSENQKLGYNVLLGVLERNIFFKHETIVASIILIFIEIK